LDLTVEEVKRLVKGHCHYCGTAPSPRVVSKSRRYEDLNGIDRVDSSLGYTIANCVSCCSMCNKMKMDIGQAEFIIQVLRIAAHVK
jgi:hypothetical protein